MALGGEVTGLSAVPSARPEITRQRCPGCQGTDMGPPLLWKAQPVILNYRFGSAEEAQGVPLRDMIIHQCLRCGLIFDAAHDATVTPYDARYENRQSCSPAFSTLMTDIAAHLTDHYALRGGLIMEVGCGKGEFLRLICRHAGARGVGYDTSCEEDGARHEEPVHFFKRYVTLADVTEAVDGVVCRHVVEHVAQIGDFMALLADIARTGSSRVVYIETPTWEWIVRNEAFWDIFYEHCNYFPMPTLRYLAELAGMEVLDQRAIFGGQYQALELRVARNPSAAPEAPGISEEGSLAAFAASVANSQSRQRAQLMHAGATRGWAIWGAGAKGVSLANAFPDLPPRVVVDVNAAKQGSFIPGTGVPVIAPDDARLGDVPIVLVANANYLGEVEAALAQRGLNPIVLTTDLL